MDHASCLTCLTLSSSLRMMPTTYTGVPCNPSHPLQFPIISLSFILSAFPEGVAVVIPLVDAFHTSNFILMIPQAYLNIECQLLLLSVVSTTFQLEFFGAVHPPTPFADSTAPSLLSHQSCSFPVRLSVASPQLSLKASLMTSTWPRGSYASTQINLHELLCQPSQQHQCKTLKTHKVTSCSGPCLTQGALALIAFMHNACYRWLHSYKHKQL